MIYSRKTIEELYEISEGEWSCLLVKDRLWVTKLTGVDVDGNPFSVQVGSRGHFRQSCERRCMLAISLDALIHASTKNQVAIGDGLRPIACDQLMDEAADLSLIPRSLN